MKPSLKMSVLGIGGVMTILLGGLLLLRIDVVLLLILSLTYLAAVARAGGLSLIEFIDGMKDGCARAFGGLLFFLLIGILIGTWISAGTIPALVYWGLKLLSPGLFLPTCFILCSMISFIIGTSWGTVGTIGVAVLSIAAASELTIPPAMIAGCVISGAWFGDKMSVVSDSTVLTATACGISVYSHVRAMMYTTVPAYGLSLVIFWVLNRWYETAPFLNEQAIAPLRDGLAQLYHIHWAVLIPPIVLAVMSFRRIDAIASLLAASGAGIVVAYMVQGHSIEQAFDAALNGVQVDSGVEYLDVLVNRGGIYSMMPTFLLGFLALCMGGALQKTGFLQVILEHILKRLHSVGGLVLSTMVTGVLGNAVFGDTYLSIVVNANLYEQAYQEQGLDGSMLSRTIEESATMSTPLIPWTAAGAFAAGALGISPLVYAPFAILNWITPFVSVIFAFLGLGLIRRKASTRVVLKNSNKSR